MKKVVYKDGSHIICEISWEYQGDPDFDYVTEATEEEIARWKTHRIENICVITP